MNSTTITRLYDQLSSKLGKETAESLITFIEQKVQEETASAREDKTREGYFLQLPGLNIGSGRRPKWNKAAIAVFILLLAGLIALVILLLLAAGK